MVRKFINIVSTSKTLTDENVLFSFEKITVVTSQWSSPWTYVHKCSPPLHIKWHYYNKDSIYMVFCLITVLGSNSTQNSSFFSENYWSEYVAIHYGIQSDIPSPVPVGSPPWAIKSVEDVMRYIGESVTHLSPFIHMTYATAIEPPYVRGEVITGLIEDHLSHGRY